MVVVSGGWVKNVVPYCPQIDQSLIEESTMENVAKAVLTARPNSHDFQERTLYLDQPIKVGRSVARAKPTATNAFFDCKVLSRYHAQLWYENGKFYLQDTKSSNGTFVNNNRLSTEIFEVSSGDIVQFGVDVVENNRKVTHGCIIATLKLYMPDGKEAKASPSITEGDTHVPLDDLYKLNQILQEANHREQSLETKLSELQMVVEETKRSAEESWQAFIGEERLLSRLAALQSQLQQARTNWSDDKLKEEIDKIRENHEIYQDAAKEALERIHADKQQAAVLALEQERAKISAEQDAIFAREQLEQAQLELQEVAQKLTETQIKSEEDRQQHEQRILALKQHMELEETKIVELEAKIYDLTLELSMKNKFNSDPEIIFQSDLTKKEQILAENEIEMNKSNSNGFTQNHISLTVAPVEEATEEEKCKEGDSETESKDQENAKKSKKDGKKVSFNLVKEIEENHIEDVRVEESDTNTETDETEESPSNFIDHVDSKTLKYQYQSAQREQLELRRKIDILEKNSETNQAKICDLNKSLNDEKEISDQRRSTCEQLQNDLQDYESKLKQTLEENQKLMVRIEKLKSSSSLEESVTTVSNEQLTNIEEELVIYKEKYAECCEEKLKIQKELLKLRVQYDMVCDNMYNKYFWYIAPLVIMLIYLLVSKWLS